MQVTGSNGIFVQVALDGFSIQTESDKARHSSGWMDAGSVFTARELQCRYDDVEISLFTPKVTLVPSQFIMPGRERELLSSVADVVGSDKVYSVDIPEFAATMIWSPSMGEKLSETLRDTVLRVDGSRADILPELYYMLKSLSGMSQYNKIVASRADSKLYLVIAEGRSLRLCNVFDAADFTTAEYWIFSAMKSLQLNPDVSEITFRTPLTEDEEISLCSYFRAVETAWQQ